MEQSSSLHKNPSRKACEDVIRRILSTEVLQYGKNTHFKQASDFMNYFQSLYPASDSLTKQVQRAVKALNMPKDKDGFFIPNKNSQQVVQERELRNLFQQSESYIDVLADCEPLFLALEDKFCDYAVHLIETCDTFQGKYVAIIKATNGLVFYTKNKKELQVLFESLF